MKNQRQGLLRESDQMVAKIILKSTARTLRFIESKLIGQPTRRRRRKRKKKSERQYSAPAGKKKL